MKNMTFIVTMCFLLFSMGLKAQIPPKAFSYSAVARDASGQAIASSTIGIQITIRKSSISGTSLYVENHFVNTDQFGLFNIAIGTGSIQSGSMSSIDWSDDLYFLELGMDVNGATNFLSMGATQLISVPYALHAATADSVVGAAPGFSGDYNDLSNQPVTVDSISFNSDTLYLSNGQNFVTNNNVAGTFTHYIGEEFEGGVIFHLWKDIQGVEHGLIVDKTDLSSSQVWSNVDNVAVGPAAQSSWDGLNNSSAIVNQINHTASAASLCLNSTNGGQNDWYLPSTLELKMLWDNYYTVSRSLTQIPGATLLEPIYYWTSTESNSNFAWYFYFYSGTAGNFSKLNPYYVRAIRAF